MKIGEAADYVRAVQPQQIIQIHEALLSDIGLLLAGSIVDLSTARAAAVAAIPAALAVLKGTLSGFIGSPTSAAALPRDTR